MAQKEPEEPVLTKNRPLVAVFVGFVAPILVAIGLATAAHAQTLKVEPAVPGAPAASAAQAPAPSGGIQGANIFEVKPDASADPNYAKQSNAERAKVQPGNNAPMWRDVGKGVSGSTTIPPRDNPEAGNLIQGFVQYPGLSRPTNAGEAWRQVRNGFIIPYGGALMGIALLALALFYFSKGTIQLHGAETGRKIERFTYFERAAHWTNAIAFCCLAVSGIVMAFGKYLLLPIIGLQLFGWLTYALKNLHNFVGPLFVVSLVVVIVTFVRDNFPSKDDITWLLRAGGLFGGKEVPSHRFNAGEKVLFWAGVFALGLIVVASGLVLNKLVPSLIYTREVMQIANMVHGVSSMLMMALFLGHIYMGTIGMQGAYKAMKTGYVDETWAKEHHELWHDDIKAGKIPAQRTPTPAGSGVPVQV
jgi:formate dehydrogenase subunit gamma